MVRLQCRRATLSYLAVTELIPFLGLRVIFLLSIDSPLLEYIYHNSILPTEKDDSSTYAFEWPRTFQWTKRYCRQKNLCPFTIRGPNSPYKIA
jgi:hypothetical protein